MPGAAPQISSMTIPAAILSVVQRSGASNDRHRFESLRRGIGVDDGGLVHPALKGMI
jgi:hypothetical protein